jgi:uncharacterized membrane protein
MAIAITLLILQVHVEPASGQSLASALHQALPEIGAFAATFIQISVIWVNHHSLFRSFTRVDQSLLLLNLLLLAGVSFFPLPTSLVALHTHGADAHTAALLYTGDLVVNAIAFNLIWWHASRHGLLDADVSRAFIRDVDVRYILGLVGYGVAMVLAIASALASIVVTVVLALIFVLGPSPRSARDAS